MKVTVRMEVQRWEGGEGGSEDGREKGKGGKVREGEGDSKDGRKCKGGRGEREGEGDSEDGSAKVGGEGKCKSERGGRVKVAVRMGGRRATGWR